MVPIESSRKYWAGYRWALDGINAMNLAVMREACLDAGEKL